jgi:2-polyprenyl-3-methyl-5-hydroxy-6-metoxy-1,4-benzoquinol methylase
MDVSLLSDRQKRELEYHARNLDDLRRRTIDPLDVLDPSQSRSWNAYWFMFERIRALPLQGKRCLVFGCGLGQDALALAKLGADVYAFDLSEEQLILAAQAASRCGLRVHFEQMPGERLQYPGNFFDLVLAVDIIHHCEAPQAIAEIRRVSKPEATVIFNEVYTHSLLQRIRRSWLIESCIYPLASRMIYGNFRYVTEDERKLDQRDIALLADTFQIAELAFFEAFVKRIVPNKPGLARLDSAFLSISRSLGRLAAGRFVLIASNSAPRRVPLPSSVTSSPPASTVSIP